MKKKSTIRYDSEQQADATWFTNEMLRHFNWLLKMYIVSNIVSFIITVWYADTV